MPNLNRRRIQVKIIAAVGLCGLVLAGCGQTSDAPYSAAELKARCESHYGTWYGGGDDPSRNVCVYNSPR